MDRVSRFTSSNESSTAARFERLQADRNRKRAELEAASGHVQLIPTCEDMCPEYERLERELHFDVHPFEALNVDSAQSSTNYLIDHGKAVKKYHRPAAGNETPLPEDVRTPQSLLRVLDYLFHQILDNNKYSFADRHSFIRDRSRSVRQDLTLQSCRDRLAVLMHEQIARFHIISGHVLCEADPAEFDSFQNTEQLRKVLQSLREMYDDLRLEEWRGEEEFRGYYILTHLQDPTIFKTALEFPVKVLRSERVKFAVEAAASFHRGDHVKYGRLILEGDYLQAALLHTHLTVVRFRALETISKAYPTGQSVFSVVEMTRLLSFESTEECVEFASAHEVSISDEMMIISSPGKPAEPVKPWRLDSIEAKRSLMPFSSLVVNAPTNSVLMTSFDMTTSDRTTCDRKPFIQQTSTDSKLWNRSTSNELYDGLEDFCVPLLLKEIVMDCYNTAANGYMKSILDWREKTKRSLFNNTFDNLVMELIMEIVQECTGLERSSLRHQLAMSIFESLTMDIMSTVLPAIALEVYSEEYNSFSIKRSAFKLIRESLLKRNHHKSISEHHQNRVKMESRGSNALIKNHIQSIQNSHRVVDLDKCFTFSNAIVWVALEASRLSKIKFVSRNTRIITEPTCCPHLVIYDQTSKDRVQRQIRKQKTLYSPYSCSLEECTLYRFENQIPDLAEMSRRELEIRLEQKYKGCICSNGYRKRLEEFVEQSVDFLTTHDPSLLLHPDYRPGFIFYPSVETIEKQLSQMTAGLQSRPPQVQRSYTSTPVKSIHHMSIDNSPVQKLQRVLEESRRASNSFEGLLLDALHRQ